MRMKIKRWVIGISALICIEVLLFLVLTVLLPEKTTAGGHRGVIRQATVDPVYQGKDAEYQMGEGKRGDRITKQEERETRGLERQEKAAKRKIPGNSRANPFLAAELLAKIWMGKQNGKFTEKTKRI